MYQRVKEHLARTTNNIEGWHNAFQTNIPALTLQSVNYLKYCSVNSRFRKQFLQNGRLENKVHAKKEIERNERIQALLSDCENWDNLT